MLINKISYKYINDLIKWKSLKTQEEKDFYYYDKYEKKNKKIKYYSVSILNFENALILNYQRIYSLKHKLNNEV